MEDWEGLSPSMGQGSSVIEPFGVPAAPGCFSSFFCALQFPAQQGEMLLAKPNDHPEGVWPCQPLSSPRSHRFPLGRAQCSLVLWWGLAPLSCGHGGVTGGQRREPCSAVPADSPGHCRKAMMQLHGPGQKKQSLLPGGEGPQGIHDPSKGFVL